MPAQARLIPPPGPAEEAQGMEGLKFRHAPEDMHVDLAMREKGLHQFVELLAEQIPLRTLGKGTDGDVVVVNTKSSQTPPSKSSVTGFTTRMRKRRRRDEDDHPRKRKPPDDYDRIFSFRRRAMLAYAIDVTTWQVYVGYSGGGSAVYSGQLPLGSRQHRINRVAQYLGNVTPQTNYPPLNCAEVAALNVALSHGAQIGNLFFISMDSDGNLRNPCGNCIQWINAYAFGYLHV